MRPRRHSRRKSPTRAAPHKKEWRLLEGTAFIAFFALIVGAFCVSTTVRFVLGSPQVAAVVSAVLVDLANGDRASQGFGVLKTNPMLVAAAQAKANDMVAGGYFAHVSPSGVDPWHWFAKAGYTFVYAGENLAVDFSDSGDVERAWMNSPAHRDNILNSHFTEIGIATAQGIYQGRQTTFVVQEFGAPRATTSQAPVKTIVPATPTEPAPALVQKGSSRVLGSVTQGSSPKTQVIATTSPALAATLAKETSGSVPLWAYPVSFPHGTLRYVYYAIGFLVLLALAVETGFEIRSHHRKRALRAGILLATMVVLFVAANYLFFAQPVLATTGSQQASVAASL